MRKVRKYIARVMGVSRRGAGRDIFYNVRKLDASSKMLPNPVEGLATNKAYVNGDLAEIILGHDDIWRLKPVAVELQAALGGIDTPIFNIISFQGLDYNNLGQYPTPADCTVDLYQLDYDYNSGTILRGVLTATGVVSGVFLSTVDIETASPNIGDITLLNGVLSVRAAIYPSDIITDAVAYSTDTFADSIISAINTYIHAIVVPTAAEVAAGILYHDAVRYLAEFPQECTPTTCTPQLVPDELAHPYQLEVFNRGDDQSWVSALTVPTAGTRTIRIYIRHVEMQQAGDLTASQLAAMVLYSLTHGGVVQSLERAAIHQADMFLFKDPSDSSHVVLFSYTLIQDYDSIAVQDLLDGWAATTDLKDPWNAGCMYEWVEEP